ncbi:MAG TPA: type II toxin-antitoxin system RelE/ParE family toxin [Stellaceae bacterium]|nr:type II toxin-antitoxin system RelE/ParE family toxin [Stellaceae bacterium]
MTAAVRIAQSARDWMRREAEYLHGERPEAARRFRDAMRKAQILLADQPRAGVHGLIVDTRILVSGDYLLSYRLVLAGDGETVTAVEIFAVRHGRQADARRLVP